MSLVQGIDGNLFGTTELGGHLGGECGNGCGTAFQITLSGKLTSLHLPPSNTEPVAGLALATDGNFYGTSAESVFVLTRGGKLTLYNFCSQPNCTDGNEPIAGLVQATDGYFYGTTSGGGNSNDGTVFKIDTSGTLITLHSFDGSDGTAPTGWLVEASDGDFYGTTAEGGGLKGGTIFKMTPAGSLTTLYTFGSQPGDGAFPYAGLVQGTNGDFYGTAYTLGQYGGGTVFEITPAGTMTTLHAFQGADGWDPLGGLIQATDGNFYGTTVEGGDCYGGLGCGTVFAISTGLDPFVSFVRNPAKIGQSFGVLGQGFTGTTSVLLNGTPASFAVVSDTFIRATVPVGATTGYVTVTTPTGTLTSNVPFRVIK
jgi:uncharacterized repeat protein (TIGR03803 family)